MARKRTSDGLAIIDRRYFRNKTAREDLAEAEASADVARRIRALRTSAGLTQRQLAERVGTAHSVISRLENDDYSGHSLTMLRRIAQALGKRVEIRFAPIPRSRSA